MDIRFLGHACFELSDGDTRVLIDPFLTGNPKAAVEAGEVDPTHIFLTHGHADHIGDTVDIAKRTGAQVVAIVELANEIGESVDNVADPNIGGTVEFEGGWFGDAHDAQVLKAATTPDPDERIVAVRTLLAEETRIGMMVGVAVGWELRNELYRQTEDE